MRWLLRNLWAPPLGFALLVLGAGIWTQHVVNERLGQALATDLTTIRDNSAAALSEWMAAQERAATVAAADAEVRKAAFEIIDAARRGDRTERLAKLPAQERLRSLLTMVVEQWDFDSFGIVLDDTLIATTRPEHLGLKVSPPAPELAERLKAGEAVLSPPVYAVEKRLAPRPQMWVAAPLSRNDGAAPGAVLAFRIDPEESFTRILRISRFGETGETYAFGPTGLLLSNTRLLEQLHDIGLLSKTESAILKVHVRDPGADLTRGARSVGPIERRPLTRMAESAIRGERSVDIDGYSDFRGVTVVGAWVWLPRYQFGLATEMDKREAYRTLTAVRNAMLGLVAVLGLAAAALAFGSRILARMRNSAERLERLGQYTLEERIGQGGMGTVYRARHAFLKRPTALKVIRSGDISDSDRRRFHREVQATSHLTHPNVVAIYDYGHTADGVFYYAMEYLEGVTLADLVRDDGAQPQGRVLSILRQMCGALAEAHAAGLVHRDIKPANVMLCARGGLYDVAKVLDFGLVKSLGRADVELTAANAITGTPHYMAPEVIRDPTQVDARSDVYATAAVAFFLLTGREMFVADSVLTVLTLHVTSDAPRPSSISTEPIHSDFEALLLECLDRDPSKRPADASVLLARLDVLTTVPELVWTPDNAKAWWAAHGAALHRIHEPVLTTPTLAVDLESRESDEELDTHITGREPTLLAPNRNENHVR
jgi:serine/threonine protein kinase